MVAGQIAVYFGLDQEPWDQAAFADDRVQAIEDFIRTDKANWERKPSVRAIWNGATADDHLSAPKVGPEIPPKSSFTSTCKSPPPVPPRSLSTALRVIPQYLSPRRAISIILQTETTSDQFDDQIGTWLFFNVPYGLSAFCRREREAFDFPAGDTLAGTFEINVFGKDLCKDTNEGKGDGGTQRCKRGSIACRLEPDMETAECANKMAPGIVAARWPSVSTR